MKTTIGIFNNHDLAVDAVQKLKDANFPMSHLTIMGKTESEEIDEEMHISAKNPLKVAGIGTGTVVGTALGILVGTGVFAIPGFGFIYGTGALVGALAGFDFGMIGGGLATFLATVGIKDENEKKYHDALVDGKFLLIVHGNKADVEKAKEMLCDENNNFQDI